MNFRSINKYVWLGMLTLLIAGYTDAQSTNPKYDKALADSMGADDYGMKMYVLAILKTGPVKIEDKEISDSLFTAHLKNTKRLANERR